LRLKDQKAGEAVTAIAARRRLPDCALVKRVFHLTQLRFIQDDSS